MFCFVLVQLSDLHRWRLGSRIREGWGNRRAFLFAVFLTEYDQCS
jgi:2-phosphoglycerate kinase